MKAFWGWAAIVLAQASSAWAKAPVSCVAQGRGIEGMVEVGEKEASRLVLDYQSKSYSCALSLRLSALQPKAQVPRHLFEFKLTSCRPELPPKLQDEILKKPSLDIILSRKAPRARLQWLSYEQPMSCVLRNYKKQKNSKPVSARAR